MEESSTEGGLPESYTGLSLEGDTAEGTECFSGSSLLEGVISAEREEIVAAIGGVYDPEIPVNVYELGLIYDIIRDPERGSVGDVEILMTLTAPACPVAGELPQSVADAVSVVEGVGRVCVRLTWAPPWTPEMMSEDARFALGMF